MYFVPLLHVFRTICFLNPSSLHVFRTICFFFTHVFWLKKIKDNVGGDRLFEAETHDVDTAYPWPTQVGFRSHRERVDAPHRGVQSDCGGCAFGFDTRARPHPCLRHHSPTPNTSLEATGIHGCSNYLP